MGRSKSGQFSKTELNAARIGRAIAAAARVVIIQEIHVNHVVNNKNLCERLKLSGNAVYQHIQILKETGFIESIYSEKDTGYIFTEQAEKDLKGMKWLLKSPINITENPEVQN